MKRQFTQCWCGLRFVVPAGMVLLTVLCPAPSMGQGWGGPPPGPPPAITALNIPLAALSAGLHLDAAQQDKIAVIQRGFDAQRRAAMPHHLGPPDPAAMEAGRGKMDGLAKQAEAQIEAALTASQKASLPTFIKEVDEDRLAGIPAEMISELDLTANQKKQIAEIAQAGERQMKTTRQSGDPAGLREALDQMRRQTRDKTMAVLSTAQKVKVEQFAQSHPRPRPGGFGPPPGAGGPPPPGGFGPPPDGFGPPPDGLGPPPGTAPPPPDGGPDGDRP